MGFRLIAPKRVKKVKMQGAQEVLDRLNEFLKSADVVEEPVEILCRCWKDQQNAITYKELREAVKNGYLSSGTFRLWEQDYSYLVKTQLNDIWINAMKAGATNQPLVEAIAGGFTFNTQSPGILSWLNQRGAEFVTSCTQQQKDAIAALLSKKMIESHTVDELSRMIRPCIGLTEGQVKANVRYYDSIVANMRKEHPRMKQESIHKKARDAAMKYAERQHRQRAMTIAQTESAYAYNRGADEGIRQAQAQNLMGTVIKRWSTSGDDAVCSICEALEGMEVEMDKGFPFKGKHLFSGQDMLPPAHPRCACAIEYIEVSPQSVSDSKGSSDGIYSEEHGGMQKLGEIDVEKTEEALEHYGNLFRDDSVENVLIIDRTGNVYHAVGGTSNVDITSIDLVGAFITHNHPISNGILSFGKDDFYFLRDNQDIVELRCVNAEYDYYVSVLKDMSEVVYNEIYKEAFQYFQETGFEIQHKAMELLRERGYVRYARKKINT